MFKARIAPAGTATMVRSELRLPARSRSPRLAAPAETFQQIHLFTGGLDGANPYAGVTVDAGGNLYGTTSWGGSGLDGNVYKLSRQGAGWNFAPLYGFLGGSDGNSPRGELTIGSNGTLYGTTIIGAGAGCYADEGCGTVFSLRPGAHARASAMGQWMETQLYAFTGGTDGYEPSSRPVMDAAGNLYGVTRFGGVYGHGSVYQLTPGVGGWPYQLLYSFTGTHDGKEPISDLVMDSAGNLYGATNLGGYANCGAVFQLSPSGSGGWTESTIYSFRGQEDAGNPLGLTIDRTGNLYGVTTPVGCLQGDCGALQNGDVVFMLSPNQGNWTYQVIGNYSGLYNATISMGADGNLYGLTAWPGLLFRLSPEGGVWTYTELHHFNGDDGFWPQGHVVVDAAGNIYGITNQGGNNNYGEVWEVTP